MPTEELNRKSELILGSERAFANRIGAAVFEKPKVTLWMILLPILLLHFIYRMQKYRHGRLRFDEDFMLTRRRVMDVAVGAVQAGVVPNVDSVVQQAELSEAVQEPYAHWTRVLADHYMDLLAAEGATFEALVRSAYHTRTEYLLILNRLGTAEAGFYSAIKPHLAETEGAVAIIATIEEQSRLVRRQTAERIFTGEVRH